MRKFRSKKQWQILLAEQQASGKSVAEFCRGKEIHPNLFYKKRETRNPDDLSKKFQDSCLIFYN